MSAQNNLNRSQFGMTHEELDNALEKTFKPQQLSAIRVPHPRSGFLVESGVGRQVHHPKRGEGPAEFNVKDYGDPYSDSYNSLEYMGGKNLGTEPIQHVYRGMSTEEWSEAKQRGHIQSDQRGTIANWEGTNAAVDPHSAVSYLPFGSKGVVAKIRVQPEDNWFTHAADSYVRTRSPVPLDRVEKVMRLRKDQKGRVGR